MMEHEIVDKTLVGKRITWFQFADIVPLPRNIFQSRPVAVYRPIGDTYIGDTYKAIAHKFTTCDFNLNIMKYLSKLTNS